MNQLEIEALPLFERSTARMILNRGLTARRAGHAWHVTGPGVDLLAARLSYISADDLRPADFDRRRRWN